MKSSSNSLIIIFGFASYLFATLCFAENSFIAGAYNQLINGRLCRDVTRDDLKKAGFKCGFGQPINQIDNSSWEIFDWNVFSLATENQVNKNKCFVAQADKLLTNKNFQSWSDHVIIAWLGYKKARLILEKCQTEVTKRSSPDDIRLHGYKKAYQMSKRPMGSVWDETCFDNEKLNEYKALVEMYPKSLPILTDARFFRDVEKHRTMLYSKKTNAPLTDDEILAGNLKELNFIELKDDPKFLNSLQGSIKNLAEERKAITKKFEDFKNRDGVTLPADLKSYIHHDGTLLETLIENDLISKNFRTLAKSSKDTPKNRVHELSSENAKATVSNGAFCMISKYEPTIIGEILNVVVMSGVGGAGLYNVLKGTPLATTLGNSVQWASRVPLARHLYNACFNQETTATKTQSRTQFTNALHRLHEKSPKDIGFELWNFDLGDTPECKKPGHRNLISNKSLMQNCVMNTLMTVTPLQVSFPIMLSPML